MKPEDVFGIIVRTIGLIICLITGILFFNAGIVLVAGGPDRDLALAVAGIPAFLVSLWLLRGAEPLIDFAYNRLPLRFSLMSLLVVMTIAALLLAAAGIVLNR
jgi:hypothetical protein